MSLLKLSDDRTLRVRPGEPQLQDFSFCNDQGECLGKVEDLVADTDTMKVRFLIVGLREGLFHKTCKIVVPIRDVAVDAAAERVTCSNCTEKQLHNYPHYKGGSIAAVTKRFRATFLPKAGTPERPTTPMTTATKASAANQPTMADKDVVGNREPVLGRETLVNDQVPTGTETSSRDIPIQIDGPVVHKTVTEHEVVQPVDLNQERAEITVHKTPEGQRSRNFDTGTVAKTNTGAEPVSKTDIGGDKIDAHTDTGMGEKLGRPDHMYDEPLDRPLF